MDGKLSKIRFAVMVIKDPPIRGIVKAAGFLRCPFRHE